MTILTPDLLPAESPIALAARLRLMAGRLADHGDTDALIDATALKVVARRIDARAALNPRND